MACYNRSMQKSGIGNMKAWIHPVLYAQFRLLLLV